MYGKRAVQHDFEKDAFDLFLNDDSEFLIIDLVDERFKNISYRGSVLTYSVPLENGLSKHCDEIKSPKFFETNREINNFGESYLVEYGGIKCNLSNYLDDFADKISEIYCANKIVLHKVYYAYHYRDNDGLLRTFDDRTIRYCDKMNTLLKYMYDYLESKFKECFVIDISRKFFCCEDHQWGLAPFHYENNYSIEFQKIFTSYLKLHFSESFSELMHTPLLSLLNKIEAVLTRNGSISAENSEAVLIFWGCGQILHDYNFSDTSYWGEKLKKRYDLLLSKVRFVDKSAELFFEHQVSKPSIIPSIKSNIVGVVITPKKENIRTEIMRVLEEMRISKDLIFHLEDFINSDE